VLYQHRERESHRGLSKDLIMLVFLIVLVQVQGPLFLIVLVQVQGPSLPHCSSPGTGPSLPRCSSSGTGPSLLHCSGTFTGRSRGPASRPVSSSSPGTGVLFLIDLVQVQGPLMVQLQGLYLSQVQGPSLPACSHLWSYRFLFYWHRKGTRVIRNKKASNIMCFCRTIAYF
jgi:hypothetical protein